MANFNHVVEVFQGLVCLPFIAKRCTGVEVGRRYSTNNQGNYDVDYNVEVKSS